MALATRAEVKAALGISSTDDDAKIDALLQPISDMIERTAGRAFTSATVTERYLGGEPTLALRRWPVSSITSVTDKVTGETLSSDKYDLDGDYGLLRRLPLGAQWAKTQFTQTIYLQDNPRIGRWEVVYVGGPSSVPGDVLMAFYETFASQLTSQGGMQSEKDGDYSYTRAPGVASSSLPPAAAAVLAQYKAGGFV